MGTVVGRNRELATVRDVLRQHELCIVTGPGGVGKSTLAAVLAREAGERALCVDAQELERPELVIGRIAEALDADHVVDPHMVDRVAMCERLAARLGAAGVELLVVENAEHHGDELIDLLGLLGRRVEGVGILVTSRSRPTVPAAHIVPLSPLPTDQDTESPAHALFRDAYVRAGGDPGELDRDEVALRELLAESGGLPLSIIVLASRAAILGLDAVRRATEPPAEGATSDPADDPVHATLERSLHDLDAETSAVFDTLGVFHGPVGIEDVAAVAGLRPNDAAAAIEQLARRSLVALQRNRVTMLPPLRRLAISRLPGRADERRRIDLRHAEWATDRCRASPPPSTAETASIEDDLVAAASTARREGRFDDAIAIAATLDDALRADLRHRRRLDVLRPLVDSLRAAAELDDRIVDSAIETMRRTALACADADGWAAAGPLVDEATALLPRSSRQASHCARIEAVRANAAFESGDLDGARHAAGLANAAGAEAGDAIVCHASTRLLADVELESGNLAEAVALANEVVRTAPVEPRWLRAYGLATVAACELERGATELVLAAARQLAGEARELGDVDLVVESDWLTAMADPRIAPASYDLSGERTGNSIIHIQADIAGAIRCLASGDLRGAITRAADCELRAAALPMFALVIDAQLLVGEAAVGLGEIAEARRAHRAALVAAATHGYRLRVPDALDGIARMAEATGASADDLRLAAAAIRTELGAVDRAHRRRPSVASVPGAPPSGWIDGGDLTGEGLRGALARTDTVEPPRAATGTDLGLSPAERVVADLVADGHTNREIGERLHVSRRTVESHIAHAFQKLNVTSRTQLAAIVIAARHPRPAGPHDHRST